jgi:hypothetical protein
LKGGHLIVRPRIAVVVAFALCVSLPGSARAATGQFTYVYNDQKGAPQTGHLNDPPSKECINLPEVADHTAQPASTPKNFTDATATVFSGIDCDGDHFILRPHGGSGTVKVKLRSVVFS